MSIDHCEAVLTPHSAVLRITVDLCVSVTEWARSSYSVTRYPAAPSLILEQSRHVARHRVGCCAAQSNRPVQTAATNLVNKTLNITFESSPPGGRYCQMIILRKRKGGRAGGGRPPGRYISLYEYGGIHVTRILSPILLHVPVQYRITAGARGRGESVYNAKQSPGGPPKRATPGRGG